ncbi:recombinase family protein [Pseudomonas sp. PMCC200344]|uniref:recombinase family protein n=1 Tax=Pseudomonas sp. PMCC200344 TaxID=3042028 RepID=UPI0024B3A769|nr:recombinase family protein [Pseudomonas sp. PMCC200344]
MTALAYFLVGNDGQETLPKLGAIEKAVDDVHWFADMASSESIKALARPGFSELHQFAKKGDVLVISTLDCLGTIATELDEVFRAFKAKGVAVITVREGLHLFASNGATVGEQLAEVLTGEKHVRFERLG